MAVGLGLWYYVANYVLITKFDPGRVMEPEDQVVSLEYRVVQSTPSAWAKISTLSYNATSGQVIYKEAMVTDPETLDYRKQLELNITKGDFSNIYSALKDGLEKTKLTTKQPKGTLELLIQVRFRDDSVLTIYGQGGLIVLYLSAQAGQVQYNLEPASALDGFVKTVTDLTSAPA